MDDQILLLKTAIIEENRESGRTTIMAVTLPVENRNGFVFGVAEARSRSVFAQTVMEIIRDRLTRLAKTIQESASAPRRFEQTLEAINEEIAARAAEMDTFALSELNAIIGLAVDQTVYLSGTGELTAIFLHKLPKGKYQVFNLARGIQTEQVAAGWQKVFVVILDGDLNAGDVFCVCNQNPQHELSPEEFHSILATLPPQSAAMKLRQSFPAKTDMALFILRVSGEEGRPRVSAPTSLKHLQASREQTKLMLDDQKPSFFRGFIFWIALFLKNRYGWWRLIKALWRLGFGSVKIVLIIFRDLSRWFFWLARRLTSSERKEIFKTAGSSCKNRMNFFHEKIKHIPKTSRYLILAALVMVVIIIFGVISVSRSRQAREERAAFEVSATRVETLGDAVESALIYKDENKARTLLNQATSALNAIITDDPDNQKRLQTIRVELETMTKNLRRINEIENPEILASAAATAGQPTLSIMTLVEDNLYLLGNNQTIYRLNSSEKKIETVIQTDFGSATAASVDETVLAWLDDKSVINLLAAPDGTIKAAAAAPDSEKWVDLYAYADRLYVLSPRDGLNSQVYRLSRADTELGPPIPWIKSLNAELSDAVSLAVDGTVFVLRANGKILRFVSGRDVTWTQGTIEPELTSASNIWTSTNSSFIYVLDPVGQRLVVYEKESGNLKVQYHSGNFIGLTDFAVDETNKTIYLLGNGNVYKIEATHLK